MYILEIIPQWFFLYSKGSKIIVQLIAVINSFVLVCHLETPLA